MANRIFKVIDLEEERIFKKRRKIVFFAILVSISTLAVPLLLAYAPQWHVLVAARNIALTIQRMKTRAIITQKPQEMRISSSGIDLSEVESCGVSTKKNSQTSTTFNELAPGVELASAQEYVDEVADVQNVTTIERICYDPLNGSSLSIDGVLRGSIVLMSKNAVGKKYLARIVVEGIEAEPRIE